MNNSKKKKMMVHNPSHHIMVKEKNFDLKNSLLNEKEKDKDKLYAYSFLYLWGITSFFFRLFSITILAPYLVYRDGKIG